MYALEVFYPGADRPRATFLAARASEVLSRIPELLREHGACERIVVLFGDLRLFAVDCEGVRLPD